MHLNYLLIFFYRSVFVVAATIASFACADAVAQDQIVPSPSEDIVISEIRKTAQLAAREMNLNLEPDILLGLAADANIFVGNFCFDQPELNLTNICDMTFNDPDVLKSILAQYLEDLVSRPQMIETVASRLAKAAGREIEGSGWPGSFSNEIGLVELPPAWSGSELNIGTATGRVRIGATRSRLLLRPGKTLLIATLNDGTEIHQIADVASGAVGILADAPAQSAKMLGRINTEPSHYCARPARREISGPLATFNWGRATFAEPATTRLSHRSPAASQAALDIEVIDSSESCDEDCKAGIAIGFAQAIAIWRSGCENCDPGALAILRIGERIWLDRRATEGLRRMDPAADSGDNALALLDNRNLFPTPSLFVPRGVIVGYDQIDSDPAIIDAICRLQDKGIPWLKGARAFLCPGAPGVRMDLKPTLTIMSTPTECGPEAIACGKPGGGVQLTTADYSFRVPTPNVSAKLGSAERELDVRPILLHEVGHWFGLPHPSEVGLALDDIMAGVFEPGRECVSAESLTMLSNAADDRWPFRAESKQGLLPPRTASE